MLFMTSYLVTLATDSRHLNLANGIQEEDNSETKHGSVLNNFGEKIQGEMSPMHIGRYDKFTFRVS